MLDIGASPLTNGTNPGAPRGLMETISASSANYWASYVVDFGCAILFAYLGAREFSSWWAAGLSFLLGVFGFSLAEYSIHRWLLHNPESPFYVLHDAHHKRPGEPAAFLAPTSLVVLMLVWLGLRYGLHYHAAGFWISGFAAGYSYYGVLHHVEHSTRINQIPFRWLQSRWAAHSVHHRRDFTNYGVITSFWDHVFGTKHTQKKHQA